jgi:hypothetical protein
MTLLAGVNDPTNLGTVSGLGGFDPGKLGTDAPQSFTKLASTIFGFLTIIAGLSFILYFITGALNWITSNGDEGKVDKAKSQMTAAAIGLIIVIASYSIIGIIGNVLGLNILDPAATIKRMTP